jgi:hypothetical protein
MYTVQVQRPIEDLDDAGMSQSIDDVGICEKTRLLDADNASMP